MRRFGQSAVRSGGGADGVRRRQSVREIGGRRRLALDRGAELFAEPPRLGQFGMEIGFARIVARRFGLRRHLRRRRELALSELNRSFLREIAPFEPATCVMAPPVRNETPAGPPRMVKRMR